MEKKHSPVLLAVLVTALAAPLQAAEAIAEPTTNAAQAASRADAGPQEAPCLRFGAGNRVRLQGRQLPGQQVIGQFVGTEADAITVLPEVVAAEAEITSSPRGVVARIPLSQIERIDVSIGKHSHAGTGALIAASVPAAFAVLGLILGANEHPTGDNLNGGYLLAGFGAIAVAPAALLGAGLGALSKTDRWERACTKSLRVSVTPDLHGGARARLAVRF